MTKLFLLGLLCLSVLCMVPLMGSHHLASNKDDASSWEDVEDHMVVKMWLTHGTTLVNFVSMVRSYHGRAHAT